MKKFTIEVSDERAAQIAETLQALDGVQLVGDSHETNSTNDPADNILANLKKLDMRLPENRAYAENVFEAIKYWESIGLTPEMTPEQRRVRYLQNWRPAGIFKPEHLTPEFWFAPDPETERLFS